MRELAGLGIAKLGLFAISATALAGEATSPSGQVQSLEFGGREARATL